MTTKISSEKINSATPYSQKQSKRELRKAVKFSDNEDYHTFLKEIYFFEALSEQDIRNIQKVCQEEYFDKGEVIFHEGKKGDRFYIIIEGEVEIWKDYGKIDQDLLTTYQKRKVFGELALITNTLRSATVIAAQKCRLLSIKQENFSRIIEGSSPIALGIMKSVSVMIRERTNDFVNTLRNKNRCLETAYQQLKTEAHDRRKAEEQLRQAQKMEAIGSLAGGIAHEFNNLLQGIQGHISLMCLQITSDNGNYSHLKAIEGFIREGATLNQRLLAFAGSTEYIKEYIDINRILANSARKFRRIKNGFGIHEIYEKDIWNVFVNPYEIEQVFWSLYLNAWEAMPQGGVMKITTHNISQDDKQVEKIQMQAGNYVKITVSDTGAGVDPAIIHRIFDPFFTTKTGGRGTGLGLSSAYNIIKNHGGFIFIESEQNVGTCFNIYLPSCP